MNAIVLSTEKDCLSGEVDIDDSFYFTNNKGMLAGKIVVYRTTSMVDTLPKV